MKNPLSYDVMVNFLLVGVILTIVVLLVRRWMEKREFTYQLTKTPDGMVFSYVLGIYAGTVRIRRVEELEVPRIKKRSNGWELAFPSWYSDDQVFRYILANDAHRKNRSSSHAHDLEIFRQVVLKNNDKLMCITGKLYTGDRRKNPR